MKPRLRVESGANETSAMKRDAKKLSLVSDGWIESSFNLKQA